MRGRRIRWANVARLGAIVAAALVALAVAPSLFASPDPPPPPADVGLAFAAEDAPSPIVAERGRDGHGARNHESKRGQRPQGGAAKDDKKPASNAPHAGEPEPEEAKHQSGDGGGAPSAPPAAPAPPSAAPAAPPPSPSPPPAPAPQPDSSGHEFGL